jgi:hypothetical protein
MVIAMTTESPAIAAILVLPVVGSLDAAIEAAWYDHLRPRVDAKEIAAVFC